ncbi:MAG: hypothetical protein DWQ19_11420 [Crenarchaeota archaeon]|nr:MAG: hypothetical protein DWQ19_11420 [Thermoproteota archaeon]
MTTTHWLVLAALLVYAALFEYCAHRWLMHKPLLGRFWWYTDHAIEHHGKERYDINIGISPLLGTILMLPCLAFWAVIGWTVVPMILIISFVYGAIWTTIHSAHHDLPGYNWAKNLPGYNMWRTHHLVHHDHPGKNFGTVFIFTDFLFGTWARY